MKLSTVLIYTNFMLILIFPTVGTFHRAVMIIGSLVIGITNLLLVKRSRFVPLRYTLVHFWICSIFLVSLIVGFINENPGVSSFFYVFIVYPLIYFMISLVVLEKIVMLEKIIIFSVCVNAFIGILMSIIDFYRPNTLGAVFEIMGLAGHFGVGRNEVGMPEFLVLGYVCLVYGTTFLLSKSAFIYWFPVLPKVPKKLVILSVLCVGAVAISGQRSFFVGVTVSSFLLYLVYFLHCLKNDKKFNKTLLLAPIFGAIFVLVSITYFILKNSDLDFYSAALSLRSIQIEMFLSAFDNNYVFGTGFGYVGYLIRSVEMPWAYEPTYYLLIASMGILPFRTEGV